uniref:Uncharacterized protein n=1 Tax=Opuntia streptacantha TaxID=393608 RepID=A0A7C9EQ28_OPUST
MHHLITMNNHLPLNQCCNLEHLWHLCKETYPDTRLQELIQKGQTTYYWGILLYSNLTFCFLLSNVTFPKLILLISQTKHSLSYSTNFGCLIRTYNATSHLRKHPPKNCSKHRQF